MYKQAIVIRGDLKMSRGKAAAQAAHASVSSLEDADKKAAAAWKANGQKKVVLKAKSEQELTELAGRCKKHRVAFDLISDAGLTEVAPGTLTALGVGPDEEEKINKITGSLPLLK